MARWVEHDGERVLAEVYEERLHPRGRGGRWIGKLVRVKDAEWQQALDKEATAGKVIKTKDDPRGTMYLGGDMPPSRTGTVLSVEGDKATVKFGDQVRNGVSLTAIEPVEPTMGVDRGAFGWPATQHAGQNSDDAPPLPDSYKPDTNKLAGESPVDIRNGWQRKGVWAVSADGGEFGDDALGQAYQSLYKNPKSGQATEISHYIEYVQARNQPGSPYRYVVSTREENWDDNAEYGRDSADISYPDDDVRYWTSYDAAVMRAKELAMQDRTGEFVGEPVGPEGRAAATPGQSRLFEGAQMEKARWVEKEGQRFLVEADGKCTMPHKAMSKRGKTVCPNCKAKIGDLESTEEDAKEKVEEARRGQVTDQEIADEARRIEEAADSLIKASTHKHGLEKTPGKQDNWVERTGAGGKGGQLPAYIQHIALALKRKRGMPTSQAIAIAIGTVKRWARGGGNVDANTRAAAAKALAEWAAMKSKAHIKSAVK